MPDLYAKHRGKFMLHESDILGDPDTLDADAKETIDAVLQYYGDKSAQWLSDLTHREAPWKDTRCGLPDSARSDNEINLAAIEEYYSSLILDVEEA